MEEQQASEQSPQTSEKPDLLTEMREYAKKLEDGDKQVDAKDQAQDPKPTDEGPSEEEKDPESKEEDQEEKDPEEKKDEEKNRPNRYQKQKAKIEALTTLQKKTVSERDEAILIANQYRERLLKVVKKYEDDFKAFKAGKIPTDSDQELWTYKAKQEEAERIAEIKKQQEQERIKAEINEAKAEQAAEYQSEALGLAKTYGLAGDEAKTFARRVLLYAATEWERGNQVSLKDVASEFGSILKNRRLASQETEQRAANAGAPKILQKGGTRTPNYEIKGKDPDEQKKIMAAYLQSLKGK
jgi:hypothetical protein